MGKGAHAKGKLVRRPTQKVEHDQASFHQCIFRWAALKLNSD
jgi:hypothetical protein